MRPRNPTDKPIDGISTYNVIPFEAGVYFNKIQGGNSIDNLLSHNLSKNLSQVMFEV